LVTVELAAASRSRFVGLLPDLDCTTLPQQAVKDLLTTAEELLKGHRLVFGYQHPKFDAHPDWFVDARSGRRAPPGQYAFDIPYRNAEAIGDIKYIWEPSRHHHLTVLAAAYAVTRDERYATHIASHLRSWWDDNPFLSGPHWISGIELGIRLIAWVWVRRLLHGWPGAAQLFEENPRFLNQLYWHQQWLAAFPSRGSSANNHLIAEAAGQFIAACAFPCFENSSRWRQQSETVLQREVFAQTFASGLSRELATDYHGLVLELLLAAAIEGELANHSLGQRVWGRIRAMVDALATIVDAAIHPPRQGDSDDGSGLLLDNPSFDRWESLLATGKRLFGSVSWWPERPNNDLRTSIWTCGIHVPELPCERATLRPNLISDAGHVYLRSGQGEKEIWCRCDHGPHGFLRIAAHAHADALAIEVRAGGVQLLCDPGTYCYHSESIWREYFRSTLAHNTLELLGQDQSTSKGPFLWIHHAQSLLISADGLDENATVARWQAEHTGYVGRGGFVHRRTVTLDRPARLITIHDELRGKGDIITPARLAFHLGPSVECSLTTNRARLSWHGGTAELDLPDSLEWTLHRGEVEPPLGWYSPTFGVKCPSISVLGVGSTHVDTPMVTRLQFQ
jgi:hypothetical protein